MLKFILKEELFTLILKTFIGKVDHFGSTLWHKHTNFLVLSYEKSKISIDRIITEIRNQNVAIQDISTDDGDLEDVFLRLTKN